MTIQEAYQQLLFKLFELYDDREAANICDWVIEHVTGFKKIDRITNKKFLLSDEQQKLLSRYSDDLMQHKPVQYVLHEAWFGGLKLFVDENVLIPRPETEELVDWIKEAVSCELLAMSSSAPAYRTGRLTPHHSLLDIGTGSGCISIALKKKLPSIEMHALDISEKALTVAKRNAAQNETEIHFFQLDILNTDEWNKLPQFDIIVSNPPYIKESEAIEMHQNVLQHEPHIALFVPGENALVFYKTIAAFGATHLNKKGKLFFEINEMHGKEVCDLLEQSGYVSIEVKKDMQGKDRMVKAELRNVSGEL